MKITNNGNSYYNIMQYSCHITRYKLKTPYNSVMIQGFSEVFPKADYVKLFAFLSNFGLPWL